jgi:hypothetical protein
MSIKKFKDLLYTDLPDCIKNITLNTVFSSYNETTGVLSATQTIEVWLNTFAGNYTAFKNSLNNVDNTSDATKQTAFLSTIRSGVTSAGDNLAKLYAITQSKQDSLGFSAENAGNKNNATLNNSATEYPSSALVLAKFNEVKNIATGRVTAYVFNTLADLDIWLSVSANTATLRIGDDLLILATNTPDYWWDGTQKQVSETSSVNLSGYVPTTRLINGNPLTTNITIPVLDQALTGLTTALGVSAANTILSALQTILNFLTFTGTASSTKVLTQAGWGTLPAAKTGFNHQTGTSYTLQLSDASVILVTMNNASANTLTIPPHSSVAFAVGAQIEGMSINTGQTTIVAGAGVTILYSVGLKLADKGSAFTLTQSDTLDIWYLAGRLAA